jgi:hypothetical protein
MLGEPPQAVKCRGGWGDLGPARGRQLRLIGSPPLLVREFTPPVVLIECKLDANPTGFRKPFLLICFLRVMVVPFAVCAIAGFAIFIHIPDT